MLNIVIAGAGDIGRHIATVLSKEEHNIIMIDPDAEKLERASLTMDVGVRQGSGTDWQILDDLLELSPNFLIAATGSDETNLVCCNIGRALGYPRTIARVRDNRFLNRTRLDFAHLFETDFFVGPELLVANDILKYMMTPGSINVEHFAHGAVQMRTLLIPKKWRKGEKKLHELTLPKGVMIGLIMRKGEGKSKKAMFGEVIFPHGDDTILPGDEVTLIGETDVMADIHQYFGISQDPVQSVVMVGGSLTAINLAKLLEKRDVDIRILDKDYDRCCLLAELLPDSTIINHDATDIEFLKGEKVGNADLFLSATRNDEINLMTGILAKEVGVKDVVALLTNTSYAPFIEQHGINHVFSPRISAANTVMSQVYSSKVSTLVSLYDNRAEVIEVAVSNESKLVGIPISQLGPFFPKDFLITMIQNRGRIMVAHGSRIISPGDTVIVITTPEHLHELGTIF